MNRFFDLIKGWGGVFFERTVFGVTFDNAQIQFCFQNKVIMQQSPLVAYQPSSEVVLAVGEVAAKMKKKAPKGVKVVLPFDKNHLIYPDLLYEYLDKTLAQIKLNQLNSWRGFGEIRWAKPSGISPVHAQAIEVTLKKLGFLKVTGVERVAAAYENLARTKQVGDTVCVLVFNEGMVEWGFFYKGQLIEKNFYPIGGEQLVQQIIKQVKICHHTLISDETALHIRDNLLGKKNIRLTVRGKQIIRDVPVTIQVECEDFVELTQVFVRKMVENLTASFNRVFPEILSESLDAGILMTGNSPIIKEVGKMIEADLKSPVLFSKTADQDVARGLLYENNLEKQSI